MKRAFAILILTLVVVALAAPAAPAAEKTELTYSVKDARAFLWDIYYPQSTFLSEFYGPCNPETDPFKCDRNDYDHKTGTCGEQALGMKDEARAETPTRDELEEGVTEPTESVGTASDWPRGNPVQVIHGLALGRLGSSPEAGGMASMYYVDNSGRRESRAHVESDAYVSNRRPYEERCAVVDAISESDYLSAEQGAPFAAHMLSRADDGPSTYNMSAFTTMDAAYSSYPPGQSKESVSVVKLWQADGRVNGVLTSTVRALRLADQITVDAVRSIISFSSDGTAKGLRVAAKTEALGLTVFGTKLPSLADNDVIVLGEDSYLGVLAPVIQQSKDAHDITVRAPGLFLATNTNLNTLPIPEDPFQYEEPGGDIRGRIGDVRDQFCEGSGRDPSQSIAKDGCRLTLGGKLFRAQVVYVAGAILDTSVGRVPAFSLPPLPPLPDLPGLPPVVPPTLNPPTYTNTTLPVAPAPVGVARFEVRELAGTPWPLATIILFSGLGFLAVMGRWSMRYPWARSIARVPPFPAFGWAYRAFLKG